MVVWYQSLHTGSNGGMSSATLGRAQRNRWTESDSAFGEATSKDADRPPDRWTGKGLGSGA